MDMRIAMHEPGGHDRQPICRWAIAGIAVLLVCVIDLPDSQAGPVRRIRRRAARAAYQRTSYGGYWSGGYGAPLVAAPYGGAGYPANGFGAYGPSYLNGPINVYADPSAPPGYGPPPAPSNLSNQGRYGPRTMPVPAPTTAPVNAPSGNPGGAAPILSDADFIRDLYRDALGREPDEAGLTAWVQALDRGMSRRAAANYFLNSRERSGVQASPARPAVPIANGSLEPALNGPALNGPANEPVLAGPEAALPAANPAGVAELPQPEALADPPATAVPNRRRARGAPRSVREPVAGYEF
jgi:hypothetical protein